MAYQTCEDCGCRVYGGICSNCQEELYIVENQYDAIDAPLSREFMDKVEEQKCELKTRKEKE